MNNYELFSENYGCYFSVVTTILESAANGISREDIDTIVSENAFYESAFHLLPKLFSGEWSLLEKKEDGLYYSKIQSQKLCKPLTSLELAWLKAILNDKRIRLFLEDDEYFALLKILENIDPLFKEEDFHYFDRAADADPFDNTEYTQCFKTILAACINKEPVKIHYESGKGRQIIYDVFPYKLSYSAKDDKFRLLGAVTKGEYRFQAITLNIGRILNAEKSGRIFPENFSAQIFFSQRNDNSYLLLKISKARKAIERFMLQFAAWEKHTEYNDSEDYYTCKLFYDKQDETELLIRILGFGPVIAVIEPEDFRAQIRDRVNRQLELGSGYAK